MASSRKKSAKGPINEEEQIKYFRDLEEAGYSLPDKNFEYPRAKRSKSYTTDATQCSKVQPAQDPDAKAVQFTFFKRLSQETQDAVWKLAIDAIEPRVVEIWEGYRKESSNGVYPWPWTGEFTSSCPIPGLLQACRDSRRLALNVGGFALPSRSNLQRFSSI